MTIPNLLRGLSTAALRDLLDDAIVAGACVNDDSRPWSATVQMMLTATRRELAAREPVQHVELLAA
jgi:hypothetical protein